VRLADFDFDLPEDRIALRPARPRDSARLLRVAPNAEDPFQDMLVGDLPGLLAPGDALIFNDTRVIPAALTGIRSRADTSAVISLTLHKRLGQGQWRAFARPAKRLKRGDRIEFGQAGGACAAAGFWAEVTDRGAEGEVMLAFELSGPALEEARQEAFVIVEADPELLKPEHRALREALLTRWRGKLDLASVG